MSHPLWSSLARAADTPLSAEQLDQLDRYLALLTEWNAKLNLTRIVDRADAEVRHIADALTLLPHLPRATEGLSPAITLADVGTGGGVPGVPLAIARPDLRVTLIDSTKKKLDAISAMVESLGLTNVAMRHARIETVTDRFDVITARAVAELDTLLSWCEPLMHPRSVLLALKGPRAADEIERIDRKRAQRFEIESIAIDQPELPGHVLVRVCRRR